MAIANDIVTTSQNSRDEAKTDTGISDNLGSLWLFWRRRRFVVAFLSFLAFFNVYALRVNLSVAIVDMTAVKNITLENGTQIETREFDWSPELQGLILGSFFYGYVTTQILGGWLAVRIGGSKVLSIGIAMTALLTLFTPVLARTNVYLLFTVRIIEGIFEGVTYPCMLEVWSRWAPPLERSRLTSIGFSGSYVGTVVSLPLSSLLAQHFGWDSIFYVFGTIGLLWFVAWWIYVKEDPELDPLITKEELNYIQKTTGKANSQTKVKHCWVDYLKSPPVLAIICAHTCENWGFYTLLTQLPTFMKDALHFDLKNAGFMSALPYLVMSIVLQFAGHLADWLITNNIMSVTNVRKLFNCGAFLSQCIFMFLTTILLTPAGAVTCLTIAVGLGAFAWSGFSVNTLDIAPEHASVLMGISNTMATLPGIISPSMTGFIVKNKTVSEWKIIFYIASSIYLFGALVYGIFASSERQSWADSREEPDVNTKKTTPTRHCYCNDAMEEERQEQTDEEDAKKCCGNTTTTA